MSQIFDKIRNKQKNHHLIEKIIGSIETVIKVTFIKAIWKVSVIHDENKKRQNIQLESNNFSICDQKSINVLKVSNRKNKSKRKES